MVLFSNGLLYLILVLCGVVIGLSVNYIRKNQRRRRSVLYGFLCGLTLLVALFYGLLLGGMVESPGVPAATISRLCVAFLLISHMTFLIVDN